MSFLKIAQKNVTIKTMGNIMDFFTSMTGNANNPKYFDVETKDNKKFKLSIISAGKEDGSGSKFMFKAIGYAGQPTKDDAWVPVAGEIEGFANF